MEDLKTCAKCRQALSRDRFHKDRYKRDGLHSYCRACNSASSRKHSADNPGKRTEYRRRHHAANREEINQNKRRRYAANRGDRGKYQEQYYGANKQKRSAKSAINSLIRAGRISSPWVCQNCHTVDLLDAHHDDYAKPLEIRWLCRRCHQRHHAVHGEAPNGATPWYYSIAKRYKLRKKALRAIIAALPQNGKILSNVLTENGGKR